MSGLGDLARRAGGRRTGVGRGLADRRGLGSRCVVGARCVVVEEDVGIVRLALVPGGRRLARGERDADVGDHVHHGVVATLGNGARHQVGTGLSAIRFLAARPVELPFELLELVDQRLQQRAVGRRAEQRQVELVVGEAERSRTLQVPWFGPVPIDQALPLAQVLFEGEVVVIVGEGQELVDEQRHQPTHPWGQERPAQQMRLRHPQPTGQQPFEHARASGAQPHQPTAGAGLGALPTQLATTPSGHVVIAARRVCAGAVELDHHLHELALGASPDHLHVAAHCQQHLVVGRTDIVVERNVTHPSPFRPRPDHADHDDIHLTVTTWSQRGPELGSGGRRNQ